MIRVVPEGIIAEQMLVHMLRTLSLFHGVVPHINRKIQIFYGVRFPEPDDPDFPPRSTRDLHLRPVFHTMECLANLIKNNQIYNANQSKI